MLQYKEEKKVQRGSVYKQARLAAKALVVGQPTVGNNMEQYAMVYQVNTVTIYSKILLKTEVKSLKYINIYKRRRQYNRLY